MKKNIVLIGLMGSGKSMIARALHESLRIPSFSIDSMIEEQEGRKVREIFELRGETYFRNLEHAVVKELSVKTAVIIDCGGGIVLNPENIALLRKNGIIVHLQASPETIVARLKGDTSRPLMNVPNPLAAIRAISEVRLPLYNQADLTIDANDPSIEGPVAQILSRIK